MLARSGDISPATIISKYRKRPISDTTNLLILPSAELLIILKCEKYR